jgi:hypothetical protein
MNKIFPLITVLILLMTSCYQTDNTTHISYGTLTNFLKSEHLYDRFDIQNIKVNTVITRDSTHLDTDTKKTREINIHYDFKIMGKQKTYVSTADILSLDSVNWKVKSLLIIEKEENGNKKTEKQYIWDTKNDSLSYGTKEFINIYDR